MPDFGNTAVFSQTDANNNTGTMPSWLGTAAPSTLDDAGRALQGAVTREWNWRSYTVTAGGTDNVKTLTYSVAPAAYYNGQVFSFIANTTNTGAVTLNVNSLGAKNVQMDASGTLAAIPAGFMVSGTRVDVAYNLSADCFVWVNQKPVLLDSSSNITVFGTRTSLAKDGGGAHWFRTADAISEAAGIAYGFVSDGSKITSHTWRTNSTNRITLTDNGFGYVGGGANVTQATSKTTTVLCSAYCGKVTTNNAALGAGASASFQITNSTVVANDVVFMCFDAALASVNSNYRLSWSCGSGAIFVTLTNQSGGSLSEAVPINFVVFKSVIA